MINISSRLLVHIRSYLSIADIEVAIFFARHAGQVERTRRPDEWAVVRSSHRSYVIGSIFSVVAFLDATINETLSDAADAIAFEHLKGVDPSVISRLGNVASTDRGSGTLPKFDRALAAIGQSPFDRTLEPCRSVRNLIQLRNALVHYRPETLLAHDSAGTAIPAHEFEVLFRGCFELNPFTGKGNSYWPDQCLSYGCAAWAISSALELVTAFSAALGTTPLVKRNVKDLGTDQAP